MAQTFSTEMAGVDSVPAVKPNATAAYGARLKRFRATINLASQASGDNIVIADLPAGFVPAFFMMNTTVTLGTSTLSIGTATTPTLYAPAATLTTPNIPVLAGNNAAASAAALLATARVIATIAVAALPASGTLVIDTYASLPN